MKVYISVDMEGIAGVNHPRPTERDDAVGYRRAVELMVGETNAAIEGALEAGATDILVNDSHGGMFNLTAIDLHRAARLLQGQKPWSMVAGAGPSDPGATAGSRPASAPSPTVRPPTSRSSSATTRARDIRAARSHTRTRTARRGPSSTGRASYARAGQARSSSTATSTRGCWAM
jgi:D-amino peptidase